MGSPGVGVKCVEVCGPSGIGRESSCVCACYTLKILRTKTVQLPLQ